MKKMAIFLVLIMASIAGAAINWSTKITNVNVVSKRADVSFTRSDTESPNDVWSVSFNQVKLETPQQRLDLLDLVWSKWQEELQRRQDIADFITNLEQQANANLEAREQ